MDKKTVSLVIVILIALSLVLSGSALAAQGTPLPGKMIPQFVDPLPVLDFEGGTGLKTIIAVEDEEIKLHMLEFQANMMPSTFVPAAGTYTGTWVWGYLESPTAPITAQGTYLGPVIVATRNIPTQIRFVNSLTATNIAWRDWTDQTLHWADPFNTGMSMDHYMGPIPAVPHIHGGDVPPVLDGGPDSWFTSDGIHGHAYYAGTDVVGSGANPAAANESIYR
ncbi:MAG: copper oxidase, partial [bacterium]